MKKLKEKWIIVSCEGQAIHDGVSLKQAWGRYKFDKGGDDFVVYRAQSSLSFCPKGRKPRWNEAAIEINGKEVVPVNCELEIVHSAVL